MSSPLPPEPSGDASVANPADIVRHRTERDAQGRVWRFVYDPAAQDPIAPSGFVRLRCTTGTARAVLVVRADWLGWPRQTLLDELAAALQLQRGNGHAAAVTAGRTQPIPERQIARRRLVKDVRGTSWNCVYDPATPTQPADESLVVVRCAAGRDRLELVLEATWHRLGDKQLAALIMQAIEARKR